MLSYFLNLYLVGFRYKHYINGILLAITNHHMIPIEKEISQLILVSPVIIWGFRIQSEYTNSLFR